jgi:Leucine-rich repeat (LRR) protein
MTSLEVLKVSHNQLKDRLEPIPFLSHLRSLHLSANGITTLPATMSNLYHVKL